jgi:hypothetical protein
MIEVECLYCLQKVLMPVVEGIRYTKYPIVHDECLKPDHKHCSCAQYKSTEEVKEDD